MVTTKGISIFHSWKDNKEEHKVFVYNDGKTVESTFSTYDAANKFADAIVKELDMTKLDEHMKSFLPFFEGESYYIDPPNVPLIEDK